jgi:hypothetical protein
MKNVTINFNFNLTLNIQSRTVNAIQEGGYLIGDCLELINTSGILDRLPQLAPKQNQQG